MDLRLHWLHWEHRLPDATAAAVAGLAAGAVLMVLELVWTALVGGDPWLTSRRIAAVLLGPGPLQAGGFDLGIVVAAALTHYGLGIAFGLLLGWVIAGLHVEGSPALMLAIGALFGLVLYLANFHGMVRIFAWLTPMQGWATLAAHLVFGMVAALLYWKLDRRGAAR